MARMHQAASHIPALYLPSRSRYSCTDPESMEGWVSPGPGCKEQLAGHGCYANARSQLDSNQRPRGGWSSSLTTRLSRHPTKLSYKNNKRIIPLVLYYNNNKIIIIIIIRITSSSGEAMETSFLYQRVSVLRQRYNAVLLHNSLPSTDRTDWWSYPNLYIHFLNFSSPSG